MEGLETIADCDALLKKVKRRREELVQASKLAKIQQLKTVSDKWDKELDTYNQNAYPIANSHTFTIDGKRWFVDQVKPGKRLLSLAAFWPKTGPSDWGSDTVVQNSIKPLTPHKSATKSHGPTPTLGTVDQTGPSLYSHWHLSTLLRRYGRSTAPSGALG